MSSLKKLLRSHARKGELLVTPRYEQYLAENPNLLLDDSLGEMIKNELTTPQRNRRMTLSASARGACPREQVFRFTSLKPVARLNSELHALFHQGTFIHLKWQALLLDAGVLTHVELPCEIPEYRLTGTVDGIGDVPDDHLLRESHTRFGWELKSINEHGYRWVLERGPSHAHLLQIHAYMLATEINIWSLVYENKNNQDWKEFIVRFDSDLAREVRDELILVNEHIQARTLPPILPECRKRQGAYKSCPFAHVCLETDSWPSEQRRIKL